MDLIKNFQGILLHMNHDGILNCQKTNVIKLSTTHNSRCKRRRIPVSNLITKKKNREMFRWSNFYCKAHHLYPKQSNQNKITNNLIYFFLK